MEQHKPKSLHIQTELIDSGSSTVEDVIILQPEEEREVQANHRQSILVSFGMRLLALGYSFLIAMFFFRHYPNSKDLPTFATLNVWSMPGFLFVLFSFYIVGRLVHRVREDQATAVPILLSNWNRIILRPIMNYLFWTFVFFVFGGLGTTGFAQLIGLLIMFSTYDMKFRDRTAGAVTWNFISSNRRF